MPLHTESMQGHRTKCLVRPIGLEPTRRETPDPKSGASTNFATGADFAVQRYRKFFIPAKEKRSFIAVRCKEGNNKSLFKNDLQI